MFPCIFLLCISQKKIHNLPMAVFHFDKDRDFISRGRYLVELHQALEKRLELYCFSCDHSSPSITFHSAQAIRCRSYELYSDGHHNV